MGKTKKKFLNKNQKRRLKKKAKGKGKGTQNASSISFKITSGTPKIFSDSTTTAHPTPTYVPEEFDGSSELAKTYETILNNKMFRYDPTFHGNEKMMSEHTNSEGELTNNFNTTQASNENDQQQHKKRKLSTKKSKEEKSTIDFSRIKILHRSSRSY